MTTSTAAGHLRTGRRATAWLWVAFLAVHAGVAALGFVLPNQPMGDVYFVYEPWSTQALSGGGVVGITQPWVYPQWALVPMLAAHAFAWIAGYTVGWAILVTLCDAAAFWMLVGRGTSRGRVAAAAFWLAALVALGPVALYRVDAVTVPLAVAGSLWLVGRPWLGSALLAVATWMKVWPVAVLVGAVAAVRRRWAVAGGAAAVTAGTLAVTIGAGGAANALSFVGGQTGRGLQLEAPVSAVYVWRAVLHIPGSFIYYDPKLVTFQVAGPHVGAVIAVMTPMLVAAAAAVAAVGAVQAWRGASFAALFPELASALTVTLIVFNKVGSPQYMVWLTAPVVVGIVLRRRRWAGPAALVLAICVLTQVEYPLMYGQLLVAQPAAAAVLTLRNVLLVVLLVWAVARLVRVRPSARSRSRESVDAAR